MLVEYMNLKKLERYLRINLLGPGPRLLKKRIYRAAVAQRLRNTAVRDTRNRKRNLTCVGDLVSHILGSKRYVKT